MKYMLLIYNNAEAMAAMSDEDRQAIFGDVDTVMTELRETGEYVGGVALAHPSNTKTVTVRDGATAITDGPYAEGKEQFAGYLLVEVEDEARATDIAARWPDAKTWRMEVRPVMHHDAGDV